jgi:hypothetical protein
MPSPVITALLMINPSGKICPHSNDFTQPTGLL